MISDFSRAVYHQDHDNDDFIVNTILELNSDGFSDVAMTMYQEVVREAKEVEWLATKLEDWWQEKDTLCAWLRLSASVDEQRRLKLRHIQSQQCSDF
jgi:hypothetical protein